METSARCADETGSRMRVGWAPQGWRHRRGAPMRQGPGCGSYQGWRHRRGAPMRQVEKMRTTQALKAPHGLPQGCRVTRDLKAPDGVLDDVGGPTQALNAPHGLPVISRLVRQSVRDALKNICWEKIILEIFFVTEYKKKFCVDTCPTKKKKNLLTENEQHQFSSCTRVSVWRISNYSKTWERNSCCV